MSDDLVQNPWAQFEDKADPTVPTATLQVYSFIAEYLDRPRDTHVNRASSASQCFKRRWYQRRGEPGEALTPRKLVNFMLGNLSEMVMQYFVAHGCVGPGKLYSEVDFGEVVGAIEIQGKRVELFRQPDLVARIAGYDVTAHADGWGKRNSDGLWELIEFKSAADWGFDDFKENGPKEYEKQSTVTLQTDRAIELGAKWVRYFYLRKQTGHMWDRLLPFNPDVALEVVQELELSNQAEEPRAPHKPKNEMFRKIPTGRKVLGFPCTYCPYTAKCFPDVQIEWKDGQFGFGKPIYVLKDKKTEDVA